MDSLPTLPTLHAPSMPSLPSLSRSSAVASMLPGLPASLTSCSPFSSSTAAAYDDEDDDEEDDADDDEDADDAEGASASRRASHGREEGEEAPSGVSTPERKHSTSSSSAGQAADKSTRNGSAAAQTDPLKTLSGNVVVLGGYRGSILRDAKTGRRCAQNAALAAQSSQMAQLLTRASCTECGCRCEWASTFARQTCRWVSRTKPSSAQQTRLCRAGCSCRSPASSTSASDSRTSSRREITPQLRRRRSRTLVRHSGETPFSLALARGCC